MDDKLHFAAKALMPLMIERGKPYDNKDAFHRLGVKFFKALGPELGYTPGEFDVRSNKAGPAVLGDVIFHSDHIYIDLCSEYVGMNGIMYRTVKHRKDYTGGPNQWFDNGWLALSDMQEFLRRLRATIEQAKRLQVPAI